MRLLRVGDFGSERPAVLIEENRLLDCSSIISEFDGSFFSTGGLERLASLGTGTALPEIDMASVRIGAPVAKPEKIVCVGLNYTDHAAETEAEIPAEPILFLKVPGTLIGPHDDVLIPRSSAKTELRKLNSRLSWDKRRTTFRRRTWPFATWAGYAISNDVSERSFQVS